MKQLREKYYRSNRSVVNVGRMRRKNRHETYAVPRQTDYVQRPIYK